MISLLDCAERKMSVIEMERTENTVGGLELVTAYRNYSKLVLY
jgi:hypothetical protein